MTDAIEVMKFGGSSLCDERRIAHAADVVAEHRLGDRTVVVVSAMQGVTNELIAITQQRPARPDTPIVLDRLYALYERHLQTLDNLQLSDGERQIHRFLIMTDLGRLATHFVRSDWDHAIHGDYVESTGERLSSVLVAAALGKIGLRALAYDAAQCIVAERTETDPKVIIDETRMRTHTALHDVLEHGTIPVVSGFYASDGHGGILTLGRGGSDYSATILASALGAGQVTLWKDVNGIYDKDPHLGEATQYKTLSYVQACTMAQAGAKVLHPLAIEPVATLGIPVHVRSTLDPALPGTWIGAAAVRA